MSPGLGDLRGQGSWRADSGHADSGVSLETQLHAHTPRGSLETRPLCPGLQSGTVSHPRLLGSPGRDGLRRP